jgi:Cu(I)/Ag(I) efflux system membrane fusion protein/cobalt-zinc-cadmium efflux system membrane fusion protein
MLESGRTETRRQAENLLRASRERLAYWDIGKEQVRRLEEERQVQRLLPVTSPVDGIVAEVMQKSLEGMYVRPGMDLYKVADLSEVWVHAEVHERDMGWMREGLPARVSFPHDPGSDIRGTTLFLYPEVSSDTRTLKICVELPNPAGRLRPGMYADVVIRGPVIRNAVVIPESSVLRSGERDLVFVDLGEGKFEPRAVRLGIEGEGDDIQAVEGVAPGEWVVTQAQFMLDSESRLQEAIAKFEERYRK